MHAHTCQKLDRWDVPLRIKKYIYARIIRVFNCKQNIKVTIFNHRHETCLGKRNDIFSAGKDVRKLQLRENRIWEKKTPWQISRSSH